jgi:hypothetical protein
MEPIGAAEMDRQIVGRELAQLLAAAAAGRDDFGSRPDDHAFEDALAASRDHGRDGAGFGASALRIGRVLDIAAAMDGTVVGAQRGADMELRIGRMSTQHHALREVEQIVHRLSPSAPFGKGRRRRAARWRGR